jgi:hypothetical protein
MADRYYVVCEKGHFTQDIVLDAIGSPLVYLIDNRYTLAPLTTIAWCSSCNRGVEAENLPPQDAIEAAQNKISVDDYKGLSLWLMQPVWDNLEHKGLDRGASLKIKLAWRSARQSPPRCLDCGSTSLDFGTTQPDGSQYFIHPDCGGRCTVKRSTDILDINYGGREWYLSSEGEHLTTLLERNWRPSSNNPTPPDDKLITFLTRLQSPKTIAGFSTSRRGILVSEIFFALITSLSPEYIVETWIPRDLDAQQYYEQAKAQHQNPELLQVGEEAFFAPDVQEGRCALMWYQNILVDISRMKAKKLRHYPQLLPTVLTTEPVLRIFEEMVNLLT